MIGKQAVDFLRNNYKHKDVLIERLTHRIMEKVEIEILKAVVIGQHQVSVRMDFSECGEHSFDVSNKVVTDLHRLGYSAHIGHDMDVVVINI